MKKRIISVIILLSLCVSLLYSCSEKVELNEKYLSNICKYYRENGMTSWWDILAVYNADENPLDYKGYDDIIAKLNGEQAAGKAAYMLIAAVSADIGAQIDYYEEVDKYANSLKTLIENSDGSQPLNIYCFAYYALKACDKDFDGSNFKEYLKGKQLADGGFALNGESGDVDTTAIVIPILLYVKNNENSEIEENYNNAVKFMENAISEDGTFSSSGTVNSNSTAVALSALICANGGTEIVNKAKSGLELFTVKSADGFAYEKGGQRNAMATNQAAIALGDLKKGECLLYTLLNLNITEE